MVLGVLVKLCLRCKRVIDERNLLSKQSVADFTDTTKVALCPCGYFELQS
jgi:hypothetical protein